MAEGQSKPKGPDLAEGVEFAQLADGSMLLGHVGVTPVILARHREDVFAVGAACTHYGGPLAEGLLVGDTVRCPWHHACFSLRTGAALRAPALNPIDCWRVERRGSKIHVREKLGASQRPKRPASGGPRKIVILGGGAAGSCAAETLRNEGYEGALTIVSADPSAPYDRPNLSKDYLAGTAPEEWIPLRSGEFYRERGIELRLGTRALAIDPRECEVVLESGGRIAYDTLLVATGAAPVRLDLPGADLGHVHYLRTLSDSRAIVAAAGVARRAVVVGASFIGLEVAAALRARDLEVHVVAPETVPMERILGREIGAFVRGLHESHGVRFHLGTSPATIDRAAVTLKSGVKIAADVVVIGAGVRPDLALAVTAGLAVDRGIAVDEYLATSIPGIYAAGDLARWPDPHSGEQIRVEHWVVAERQGQTAARNMLGGRERFEAVPFFWSMHYDVAILYVGHAERWDEVQIDGRVEDRDCRLSYRRAGRTLAVATIGRDLDSLRAELAFERRSG